MKTELQRARAQEEANKAFRLKSEEFARLCNEKLAALRDEQYSTQTGHDGRQQKFSNVDRAKQMAEEFLKPSAQAAYADWRFAMTSIVEMSYLFVVAYNQEVTLLATQAKQTVGQLVMQASHQMDQKSISTKGSFKDIDPPTLTFKVSMNDQNALSIGDLAREDGEPLTNDHNINNSMQNLYKSSIKEWLKENGYQEDPANQGTYKDENDNVLSKQVFEALRDDPQNGLEANLTKRHEVQFNQDAPAPSPSSGP